MKDFFGLVFFIIIFLALLVVYFKIIYKVYICLVDFFKSLRNPDKY